MDVKELGYAAIGVSICASIPQIYQIIITKKVRDLNIYFFFLEGSASLLYILYGILSKDYIMMGSAIMPFINQLIILILICCYKNTK